MSDKAKKIGSCLHHQIGQSHPRLVEMAILNYDALPGTMQGWRMYRIEYGFECSCPEGIIFLPSHVSPEAVERLLNKRVK